MDNPSINIKNLQKSRVRSTLYDYFQSNKNAIFPLMKKYGMPEGTTYNRFARDGFRQWELVGINSIVRDCNNNAEIDPYEYYNGLSKKEPFVLYMMGMEMSRNTVYNYFLKRAEFKDWQLRGINNILKEMHNEKV